MKETKVAMDLNDCYKDLGYAIVAQAIEDITVKPINPKNCREAYKWLTHNENEVFMLCGMTSEYLLKTIGRYRR